MDKVLISECNVLMVCDPNLGGLGERIVKHWFPQVEIVSWLRGDQISLIDAHNTIRKQEWHITFSFYSDLLLKNDDFKCMSPLILNFHPGLPSLPGMAFDYWPLIMNLPSHGVTAHFIEDEGVDRGAIIEVIEHQVCSTDTFKDIRLRNQRLILELLASVVKEVAGFDSVDIAYENLIHKANEQGRFWDMSNSITAEIRDATLAQLKSNDPNHRAFIGSNPKPNLGEIPTSIRLY